MLFNIGDFVTRNSYGNDIIFKIVDIDNTTAYLKGIDIRLLADSEISDLTKVENNERDNDDEISNLLSQEINLDRSEYFYLPGKILHIDTDILLSNNPTKPYKIRKKAKIRN